MEPGMTRAPRMDESPDSDENEDLKAQLGSFHSSEWKKAF
jgi:hypothetical protein